MALSKVHISRMADDSSITSAKILDGTIVNADLNACAAITATKTSGFATSTNLGVVDQNVALLGFKMAVNDSITVFNLVDGVVDEFHDETGNDESESSNDTYCASSDNYINQTTVPAPFTAGLTGAKGCGAGTEPDTLTAPATYGGDGLQASSDEGENATYTVPTGMTSMDIKVWGSGGAGGKNTADTGVGGGGGYAEGTLAVTAGQILTLISGEGSVGTLDGPNGSGNTGGPVAGNPNPVIGGGFINGGQNGYPDKTATPGGGGGGLSYVGNPNATDEAVHPSPAELTDDMYVVAGSGGGASAEYAGGAGGGLIGDVGGPTGSAQTSYDQETDGGSPQPQPRSNHGGGGSQTAGGQSGYGPGGFSGTFLKGAGGYSGRDAGGGGAGYYGGAGGANYIGAGGGGSSYYGHPQITSGSTEEAAGGPDTEGGGTAIPGYVAGTNEGGANGEMGEDGYILITGTGTATNTVSTNIVSNAFTAGTAPTTARIVLFEENVATPTLNTDIIASISRDGGTTFTTATLTDSGYVTGASGQRILTGTATVSGQPSGTAMRWKLALANNAVKIHGVSLAWA